MVVVVVVVVVVVGMGWYGGFFPTTPKLTLPSCQENPQVPPGIEGTPWEPPGRSSAQQALLLQPPTQPWRSANPRQRRRHQRWSGRRCSYAWHRRKQRCGKYGCTVRPCCRKWSGRSWSMRRHGGISGSTTGGTSEARALRKRSRRQRAPPQ